MNHTAQLDVEPGQQRSPRWNELIALIGADGLSRFGSVMTITAIPWFVLVTTGSAARTGMAVFAAAIGVVLALLLGGAVVDRLSFRRASVFADMLAGIAVALIPICTLTIGLPFWLLLFLVFLAALLDTPAQVARYSALPDISQKAHVRFERANAIFDGVLTSSSLVGPAVAGVLIAVIGARNVLWIDAATFWLSALMMGTLIRSSRDHPEPDLQTAGYATQILHAARFVLREPVLFPLIVVLAIMNLAIGPIESVIVPIVARNVYHSAYVMGFMTSAIALGALGGNFIYGTIGHRLPRLTVFGAGFLVVPVAFGILALKPMLPVSVCLLTIVGLGGSLTNLLEYTIYFERIPREMRARGLGMTGALSWGTVPIGRVLAGVGIAAIGLTTTLSVFALLFLPIPLVMLSGMAFRGLNAPAHNEIDP